MFAFGTPLVPKKGTLLSFSGFKKLDKGEIFTPPPVSIRVFVFYKRCVSCAVCVCVCVCVCATCEYYVCARVTACGIGIVRLLVLVLVLVLVYMSSD